jgi:signal transduction histidine kinase
MTSARRGEGKRKKCGILGFSTEGKSSLEGDKASNNCVPIAEAFLQRLLHKYPHGQVFNFSNGDPVIPGTNDSHSAVRDITEATPKSSRDSGRTRELRQKDKQAETNALLQMLPGARSVVLFPLWDSHRERWFAGSFAWTTRSTRVLTHAEDLSYLAAFGNSIMAEVARLDAAAADRAKSDFISSISHELRSPLHGILASVEFLQDTKIDLFQNSMIDTIERCGRTLLDTIQHVLDFAKINNFAKPKRNEGKDEGPPEEGSRWRAMGLTVDIDLSVIIEDVIDAVCAGHNFQGNFSLGVYDEASGFPSEGLQRSVNDSGATPDRRPDLLAKKERLDIIMDIGWRSNWNFNTQSGALRRVLMNLFGNALKYTDAGWVYVSLQSKDIEPTLSQSPQSAITIIVSDSGRGISQEFLHGHLFTPFSQENSLNPGTGLGLSIVLQIVHSLGGTIDVQSKQGVGTEVKVSLTLNQVPLPPQSPTLDAKYENFLMGVGKRTSRLNLCLVGFNVYSGISGTRLGLGQVGSLPALSLQASLERMATQFFGMKVNTSQSWESSPSDIDIYVVNESNPPHPLS